LLEGHSCLEVQDRDADLLWQSPLVSAASQTPLIVHNGRLYLHRYFSYERELAGRLKVLATADTAGSGHASLAPMMELLFPVPEGEVDFQRRAAELCLEKSLAIISGGPGTGKTTTVVKIICLLLAASGTELRIALGAPTGKAAMRLGESIRTSLPSLPVAPEIKSAVPTEAQTLYRLLQVNRATAGFRHDRTNPLPHKVIVVDEASMVDLALMSRLVESIPTGSHLILLGDKDQLASVESGAVLTDLIRGLPHNQVILQKSFRFDSNIKQLAEAINDGDHRRAWAVLQDREIPQLRQRNDDFIAMVVGRFESYLTQVQRCDGSQEQVRALLRLLNSFRVLCGVHHGVRGVTGVNMAVEQAMVRRGFGCRPGTWYGGRPVLITANDYSLELFNGDVGLCLEDGKGGFLVWFEKGDGRLQRYPPFRLPQCETVYAMTIHKSQGSEFAEIMVVLPEEENPVLTRELLYTGITRARKEITVISSEAIFAKALARTVNRSSGLFDMLQE
jgi:exodeoxyribonuclease V alpha subunit